MISKGFRTTDSAILGRGAGYRVYTFRASHSNSNQITKEIVTKLTQNPQAQDVSFFLRKPSGLETVTVEHPSSENQSVHHKAALQGKLQYYLLSMAD